MAPPPARTPGLEPTASPAASHRESRSPRGPAVVAALAVLVTVAVIPFASIPLGRSTSFLPAQLAAVACCDLLAITLLAREFRHTGQPRTLAVTGAYLWSLIVMAGHALAFPGVVTAHGPLATAPSVVTWLHVLWHVGFPVLLALAVRRGPRTPVPAMRRRRDALRRVAGASVAGLVTVATVVALGPHLPVLVRGDDTHRVALLTAPVCLPLLLAAIAVSARAARRDVGVVRWALLAVTVCAADMALFYAATRRYSVGWYTGRLLTVVGALVIVVGLLGDLFRAQDHLAADRMLLRGILDNLSEGVALRDLGGRLLVSNAVAQELLPFSPLRSDGSPRAATEVAPARRPDGTPVAPQDFPFQRVLRTGEPMRDAVMTLPTPAGEQRWLAVNASPVRDAEGDVRGVVTSFSDVTERQEAMQALETARDDALAGIRAKAEFLATVSHEIRTPLNGLLGLNGLLARTTLDEEQRSFVEAASSCGDALLTLVNDLLEHSTLESGRFRAEVTALHLDELVSEAVDAVRELIARRGLRLEVSVDPALPQHLTGDAGRVRQLLSNLLSNAVKFTEQGTVRVSVTTGGTSPAGDALVRFSVSDTGIGIDPADVERLFEPFTQADTSTTREYGGSGLGLAIVRRLARLLGGDAGATGTPGMGSTFWFAVPLTTDADRAAPAGGWEEPEQDAPLTGRVLLAEDNPVNQLVAGRLLESWGLEVDLATDGAAAVEACARKDYDVVVMDCHMPVLDGLDATVRIHALPGQAGRAVIALTASTSLEDVERCRRAGMVDVLAKPINPALLHAALGRQLRRPVTAPVPAPRTRASRVPR